MQLEQHWREHWLFYHKSAFWDKDPSLRFDNITIYKVYIYVIYVTYTSCGSTSTTKLNSLVTTPAANGLVKTDVLLHNIIVHVYGYVVVDIKF